MEIYDIIMLVIILGAALYGAVKGFAWQLASIASIVLSYVVAYKFREPFSQSIDAEAPWNRFLAMLILFIGTSLVVWVGFRMISKSIDRLKLREFDRQVGFVFGGIKGFLYCTMITLFAVTLLGTTVRSKIVASKSGHFIAEVLDRSDSVIPEEIHIVIRPYLERFDERFAETQNGLDSDPNSTPVFARETAPSGFSGGNQNGQSRYTGGATYQPTVPSGIPTGLGQNTPTQSSAMQPAYRSATAPNGGQFQPLGTNSAQQQRNY